MKDTASTSTLETGQLWEASSPELMTAVLLTGEELHIIEISRHQAEADITERVGDPRAARVNYIQDTLFWVGETSQDTATLNPDATEFVHWMLECVTSGYYTDTARAAEVSVPAIPGYVPAIYGDAIITGITPDGSPGPMSSRFMRWFDTVLTIKAELQAASQIVRALGINSDTVLNPSDKPDTH